MGTVEEYLRVLKRGELDFMREIEPDRMAQLDEDELLALHRRIRRARNKHTTNYRRKAARTVEEEGSRGTGSVTDAGRGREHQKTTGGQKRDASSIAQGGRRQAKRDAR